MNYEHSIRLIFSKIYLKGRNWLAIMAKKVIKVVFRDKNRIESSYMVVYRWMKNFNKLVRIIKNKSVSYKVVKAVGKINKKYNYFELNKLFYTNPKTHSSSVLILASGLGTRWQGEGHKQLIRVCKKPIIERILSQVTDGVVVTHHKKLQQYEYVVPSRHNFILETFLSTHKLWKKQTVILLGDVCFNKEDLQKVLNFKGDFGVFGSKSQVEIFGLSFSEKMYNKIIKHLLIALEDAYEGGRGKLWEFYHSFVGLPLYKIGMGKNFIELENTTDIDTVEDYHNLLNKLEPKKYL